MLATYLVSDPYSAVLSGLAKLIYFPWIWRHAIGWLARAKQQFAGSAPKSSSQYFHFLQREEYEDCWHLIGHKVSPTGPGWRASWDFRCWLMKCRLWNSMRLSWATSLISWIWPPSYGANCPGSYEIPNWWTQIRMHFLCEWTCRVHENHLRRNQENRRVKGRM